MVILIYIYIFNLMRQSAKNERVAGSQKINDFRKHWLGCDLLDKLNFKREHESQASELIVNNTRSCNLFQWDKTVYALFYIFFA